MIDLLIFFTFIDKHTDTRSASTCPQVERTIKMMIRRQYFVYGAHILLKVKFVLRPSANRQQRVICSVISLSQNYPL